jgi:hypothetical protein
MAEVSAQTAEHRDIAARADAPPIAPFAQAPGKVVDLAHLARMTQGDKSLERDVLELFAMQGDVLLARMRGQTPQAVGTLAHTLCGSARGIGAWAVAQAAEATERSALHSCDLAPAVDRLAAAVAEAQSAIRTILRA